MLARPTSHLESSFTSSWHRRRLQSDQKPCGIEAIIAACNEAFGVETCECIQHSDGGCPVPVQTAGNSTETGTNAAAADALSSSEQLEEDSGAGNGVEESSGSVPPSASLDSRVLEEEVVAAELGVDGRLLQENIQAITTDLEIKFVTDVEVRTERQDKARAKRVKARSVVAYSCKMAYFIVCRPGLQSSYLKHRPSIKLVLFGYQRCSHQ